MSFVWRIVGWFESILWVTGEYNKTTQGNGLNSCIKNIPKFLSTENEGSVSSMASNIMFNGGKLKLMESLWLGFGLLVTGVITLAETTLTVKYISTSEFKPFTE